MASDFIAENELPPLLKRSQPGGEDVRLLGLVVSTFDWEVGELNEFQLINSPDRPLNGMNGAEQESILRDSQERFGLRSMNRTTPQAALFVRQGGNSRPPNV